jgi:peptide/nickel transport system substrate-binding protein
MRITRIAAMAAALAVAAGVSACGASPRTEEETVLRLGAATSTVSFDSSGIIGGVSYYWHATAAYDTLFFFPEGIGFPGDAGVEPWLATEWSYNDDRTALTITLRDDVDFVDGTPLDAEAVKVNIDDWLALGYLPMVEEVVVTGQYTVEVRSEPNATLVKYIGDQPVISPAALADREQLATEPVGSGPYLLDDYVTDSSYSFVRNPEYWNPEAFPYDRLEITLLPDLTARVNALKSGQIDVAFVDTATAPEAEAAGFSTVTGSASWAGLYFGDRRGEINPAIGDVRVRQAISMAMDRVGYNDAAQAGYGDTSNQIGTEGQAGLYIPERADDYAYDLDAAKELLAEAGYPDGFDIDIPSSAWYAAYLPYYRQTFEDLGIRVNWIDIAAENTLTEYMSGKYAVLPFGDFALAMPSTAADVDGVWNPWHNTDAQTEELLAIFDAGSDEEAFGALTELNEKVVDEAWYAVLAHPVTVAATTSDVDLAMNVLATIPLQNIRPAE